LIARHVTMKGGLFLILMLFLTLLFEYPLERVLRRLIKANKTVILILELTILALVARGIVVLIWDYFHFV